MKEKLQLMAKKVNRLLIDGREFFGGDPLIATRNLPANIVDRIQVVEDKEELHRNPMLTKDQIGQVVNVKLKNAVKQGWFGKTYGGKGTDGRYEAGGILNIFRDSKQLSVLGYGNNVNKQGFTASELQRGGYSQNGGSLSGYNQGNGIQQSFGTGINFNTEIGKRVKTGFDYFYGTFKSPHNK